MQSLITRFKTARRVGTPLLAISTSDQQAVVTALRAATGATVPLILWDIVRGWQPGNEAGRDAMTTALNGGDPTMTTVDPVECLATAAALPPKTILCAFNAHRHVDAGDRSRGSAQVVQAVANLRDAFKRDLRSLVLLGPSFMLAPEIASDVLILEDALPDDEALRALLTSALPTPLTGDRLDRAIDAVRGLAAFPAEQATYLALAGTNGGSDAGTLDIEELWTRKRQMIGATQGLSIWSGGETLEDVGGCDQIKRFLRAYGAGRNRPRCILFIDEIEKSMAGATTGAGDNTGVAQEFLGIFLREMQDNKWNGLIEVGPPGAAKSAVAKAYGADVGIPTIALDLGGMKTSALGASEAALRAAMKVIKAVGGEQVLVIATCNKITSLPPELRRRFTLGTFFFDLPDAAERAVIWDIYRKAYRAGDVPLGDEPRDEGWTGAEIKQCCMLAWALGISLVEAATYIVPVARAAAEQIEELRRSAEGRYLSASRPGLYTRRAGDNWSDAPSARRLATSEEA